MNKEQLLKLYNMPLDELLNVSSKYVSDKIEFCSLVNARNGKCSQNCKYCAQSSYYRTDIEEYPLISKQDAAKAALEAKQNGAIRFAVVTSGVGMSSVYVTSTLKESPYTNLISQ